jgi:hypothetical protein
MCKSDFREQNVPVSIGPTQNRIPRPEIEIWPSLCEAGDKPPGPRHVPVISCLFILYLLNTFTSMYGRHGCVAAGSVIYFFISIKKRTIFFKSCLKF